jgi:SAM-dependent methyltransferase
MSLRILDVGCGPGIYVKALQEAGFDATGVDIDPRCPYIQMDVFSDEFCAAYTAAPGRGYTFDLCLCLEVAEHLPENRAGAFVRLLTRVAPTVVFSAAVPGQGGHGHINCQPKQYWEQKFGEHNYVLDKDRTENFANFMRQGYHMGWLVNNVQIFRPYGDVYFDTIVAEESPQAARIAQYFAANPELFAR